MRVHPSASRQDLIAAMRASRVMLYLGHKSESFCIAAAEAQALGVPAVFAPVTALPERVIDGVTGFVRADESEFAERAVALLTDDASVAPSARGRAAIPAGDQLVGTCRPARGRAAVRHGPDLSLGAGNAAALSALASA